MRKSVAVLLAVLIAFGVYAPLPLWAEEGPSLTGIPAEAPQAFRKTPAPTGRASTETSEFPLDSLASMGESPLLPATEDANTPPENNPPLFDNSTIIADDLVELHGGMAEEEQDANGQATSEREAARPDGSTNFGGNDPEKPLVTLLGGWKINSTKDSQNVNDQTSSGNQSPSMNRGETKLDADALADIGDGTHVEINPNGRPIPNPNNQFGGIGLPPETTVDDTI